MRLHTAHRNFSQCTTSFVGTTRLGIPRMLFLTFVDRDPERAMLSRYSFLSFLLRLPVFTC
jgi:hypothetical protein